MKHETYIKIAFTVAEESKCVSWKVGALIVKDGRIISTGYNGTRSGAVNCCDHAKHAGWTELRFDPSKTRNKIILNQDFRENHSKWSKKHEIHAEINSILFSAKNGVSIDGATLYTTLSPCEDCIKAIRQSGIKTVVYAIEYDKASPTWQDDLLEAGITLIHIPQND